MRGGGEDLCTAGPIQCQHNHKVSIPEMGMLGSQNVAQEITKQKLKLAAADLVDNIST